MSTAEPRALRVGRKPERVAGGLSLLVLPPLQATLDRLPNIGSGGRFPGPGGREWITEKTRTGFVIALPAAPPAAVRLHWIARAR